MNGQDPKQVGAPILNSLGFETEDPLQATMARIRELGTTQGAMRKENIKDYENQLKEVKKNTKGMDLSNVFQGIDMLTGSNMASKYKSPKDNKSMIEFIQKNLRAERTGAVKDQMDLAKSELSLLKGMGSKQDKYDYLDKQTQASKELIDYRKKATGGGMDLTKGQEKVDVDFAKDYNEWTGGGAATVDSNLGKMEGILAEIEADVGIDDLGDNYLPEAIRKKSNPRSVALPQELAGIVFQSLKEILGGSFSKGEAEMLIQQSYDQSLPSSENLKKVREAMSVLLKKKEDKMAKVREHEEKGTLSGFKYGAKPKAPAGEPDFESMTDEELINYGK